MISFLHERFTQVRASALEHIAWMNERNERWAEEKGGFEQLTDPQKAYHQAAKKRLIDLAQYDDAATAYIDELLSWNDQLHSELRALKMNPKTIAQEFPPDKEGYREYTLYQARTNFPNLF